MLSYKSWRSRTTEGSSVTYCTHADALFLDADVYIKVSAHLVPWLHSIVLHETGNWILDMKNSKTRKRRLRVFTMAGAAAKPTEETLHQVRRVQDMLILYSSKKRRLLCTDKLNGNPQTSHQFWLCKRVTHLQEVWCDVMKCKRLTAALGYWTTVGRSLLLK